MDEPGNDLSEIERTVLTWFAHTHEKPPGLQQFLNMWREAREEQGDTWATSTHAWYQTVILRGAFPRHYLETALSQNGEVPETVARLLAPAKAYLCEAGLYYDIPFAEGDLVSYVRLSRKAENFLRLLDSQQTGEHEGDPTILSFVKSKRSEERRVGKECRL